MLYTIHLQPLFEPTHHRPIPHYLLREPVSIVGGSVVDIGPHRDDAIRVDGRMTSVVMLLDVVHVDRIRHSGHLVDILGVVE